ncbi:MAG: SGNH/GDSL hydrolase family protein [Bacilli bacterium]|nr:SGNH/GDSL hydrolase family protein [Bacilli bacterium]
MKISKVLTVLAASVILAGCGHNPAPAESSSQQAQSSGEVVTSVASSQETPTSSGEQTSVPASSEEQTSVPASSQEQPSSQQQSESTSSTPGKPVPSVTTAKNKTTVHPNHPFTFAKDPTTGNWASESWIENIVDLDPTGYTDICQIEFVIDIDFGGKNNAEQYYGGEFGIGSDGNIRITEQWGDSSGFWSYDDADATPDGAYAKGTLHQWFTVSDIVDTDQFYLVFTYAAKQTFVVNVKTVNFYHSEGYGLEEKKVNVNKKLVADTKTAGDVLVPLDGIGTNPFSYFDINLSYTGAADYTGGVVWIEGVYAEGLTLPNAPRNNVNIGKPMTTGVGAKTEASIRVYLENYCAVDPTGYIKLTCNWAPASEIMVNYVNFYTLTGSVGPTPIVDIDDEFLTKAQTPLEETLGMDNIREAYGRSLVNEGNNKLLKDAIAKMQSGDETTIGYIGGSITEGDNMSGTEKITDIPGRAYSASWAYWSYKFLAKKYGTGSNVKYHNAAMSGTASDLGVARFQKDVLDFNPSIVFIEFAVNNGDTVLEKESYESMIRMALKDPNHPAVILAMSWTSYSGGGVESYMTQLGQKYGLPVISIHKGLNAYKTQIFQYNFNEPTKCFASSDNLHPSLNGHKLYAKLICYGITAVAQKDTDAAADIPEASYSDRYETMKIYQRGDSEVTVTGFDTTSQTFVAPTNKSYQITGQGGWKLASGTGTLSMSCKAKAVIVSYCANQYDGSYGTITATISGGYSAEENRDITKSNRGEDGWGNVCVLPVLAKDTAADVTINVSFTGVGQLIGISVAA